MILVDGGGDELHAGELHALKVGVVVLVAVHVQVARQEGGHDGALVQVRVLVVDDLAEELPGVAVADRVRAEATQGILEFVVLAQTRALPRGLPPLLDGPQGPRDGFAAGIAQVRVGDRFHLRRRVDAGRVQAFGDRDERVRVDFPGHARVRVVHLEVVLDAGRRVLEVHDHGRGLTGVGAVQAREGLHGGDTGQFLVHVHGDEARLVEAGLELVGDDEDLVVLLAERSRRVAAPVERGLGDGFAVVGFQGAGEGDEGTNVVVALLVDVGVHCLEPAVGLEA